MSELLRALGVLCEPPEAGHAAVAEALGLPGRPAPGDHEDLFLFQLYPYASVYLGAEGRLGGEARGRIAGFWAALGLTPPAEPDHLAALLGLAAALADEEAGEPDAAARLLIREARRALLHEHLLSWLPAYLAKLDELAPPFYRAWGRLLVRALETEADELGRPGHLSAHLRDAPPLPDPREARAGAFLDALLAPARSGMVLVRHDLARAGAELGLGLRVAERRFVLRALFEQDAPATLRRLAAEAEAWHERHTTAIALAGPSASFLADRAAAAAALLGELSTAAHNEEPVHAG